jgi:hypothetical protein
MIEQAQNVPVGVVEVFEGGLWGLHRFLQGGAEGDIVPAALRGRRPQLQFEPRGFLGAQGGREVATGRRCCG